MAGGDHRALPLCVVQQGFPVVGAGSLIDVHSGAPARFMHLDLAVKNVACYDGCLSLELITIDWCPGVWPGVGMVLTSSVMLYSPSISSILRRRRNGHNLGFDVGR